MTTSPCRHSPFLSRKELHTACFPFAKLLYVYLFIRDYSIFPCNPHGGGTRPLSVSSSSILSFIQTYSILLSTICCADGPPFSPERETFCVLSFSATFPFYRKTFCILPLTAFLFFSEENNFFIKRREYPMPAIRLLYSQACLWL